ncbi:hypothetical protein JTB14_028622 [Gonioctena quinquepunctata]|nr:hypothetical protein JTB14_028622 [Gonioctena quinquepunctata]
MDADVQKTKPPDIQLFGVDEIMQEDAGILAPPTGDEDVQESKSKSEPTVMTFELGNVTENAILGTKDWENLKEVLEKGSLKVIIQEVCTHNRNTEPSRQVRGESI